MRNNLHNEDFERLLKDNANQYRMYPSEKVWKGIYSSLHTRRRWYSTTILSMLLVSGVLVSLFIFNGSGDNTEQSTKNTSGSAVLNRQYSKTENTNQSNQIADPLIIKSQKEIGVQDHTGLFTPVDVPADDPKDANQSLVVSDITVPVTENLISDKPTIEQRISVNAEQDNLPETRIPARLNETPFESVQEESKTGPDQQTRINEKIAALASLDAPIINTRTGSRLTAQVYMSPTISYRRLTENKAYPSSQPFGVFSNSNIKNIVNHKPAMGFEFGVAGRYRINDKTSIKTGLQFNFTRYDIRAYSHPTEIATINLNSGVNRDYVSALSNYRNFSGYTPNWLENFYFQAAIPIGAEFILGRSKNLKWGVAGTIQPTYMIGDRAYLISSDYKNYAKVPNLMRRWNLSTGLETFVSYNTGRVQWQTGPQLRYQHLSSFVYKYPVKENLFDIGIRIAAQINPKK